ncbi:MAG: hypothetical protein PHT03_05505 [Bacilli bacterium]|nr:hypothetical protein [Bacilli bacterium]
MTVKHIKKDIKERFNLIAPDIKDNIKNQIVFDNKNCDEIKSFKGLKVFYTLVSVFSVFILLAVFMFLGVNSDKNKDNDVCPENNYNIGDMFNKVDVLSYFPATFISQNYSEEKIQAYKNHLYNVNQELQNINFIYDNILKIQDEFEIFDQNYKHSFEIDNVKYSLSYENDIIILETIKDNVSCQIYKDNKLHINILKVDLVYYYKFSEQLLEVLTIDNNHIFYLSANNLLNSYHLYEYDNHIILHHYILSEDPITGRFYIELGEDDININEIKNSFEK